MSGANASPIGRSHQEMPGPRSHQQMSKPPIPPIPQINLRNWWNWRLICAVIAAAILSLPVFAQQQTPAPAIPAWNRTTAARQNAGTPAERGAAVFNNWCSACHSRDTRNAPGTRSLQVKYEGRLPAALEDRRDLTAKAIEIAVRQGAPYMSIFRKTEISDTDLQALTAYLTQSKQ